MTNTTSSPRKSSSLLKIIIGTVVITIACCGLSAIAGLAAIGASSRSSTPSPQPTEVAFSAAASQPVATAEATATIRPSDTPEATSTPKPTQTPTEDPNSTPTPRPTSIPGATPKPQSVEDRLISIGKQVCADRFIEADYVDAGGELTTIAIVKCSPIENFTDALTVGSALMEYQSLGQQIFAIEEVDMVRLVLDRQFTFSARRDLMDLFDPKDGVNRRALARELESRKDTATLFVSRDYRESWQDYLR
jgi:hypothetical protein